MEKEPFVNVILKIFHHILPPIVSFSMKGIVKSLVPRISSLLLDPNIGIPNNHGTVDQYHVVVNESPIISSTNARFNVSLEPGEGHVFTAMKDISKKSPFELYLESYQDSQKGNFYHIQGLDIEKEFSDEMHSHQSDAKKEIFGFSKQEIAEETQVDLPRVRTHGTHNLKYF